MQRSHRVFHCMTCQNCSQELTDILVDTRSTSPGSDRKDPLEAPHPDSLPSNEPKVKHNLFTRFRKDPNCEICKRTKMTRATCRRNSKSHTLRATKFGDIIMADHKVLNEDGESRNDQGMQLWYKIWPLDGFKVTYAQQNWTRKNENFTPEVI